MPEQVIVAKWVEIILVLLTSVFLVQPSMVFPNVSQKARQIATLLGVIFLCATFCWSVVFGAILFLNDMTLRI